MKLINIIINILNCKGNNVVAIPCSEGDNDWIAGENELVDYCYMKVEEPKTWQGANDHCFLYGGNLASVHSKTENTFVKGDYWLGLIKVSPGGQRHWTDLSTSDYFNWDEGGMYYE